MKNKIISAMLVGMSATMAVPVTAVMAAEKVKFAPVAEQGIRSMFKPCRGNLMRVQVSPGAFSQCVGIWKTRLTQNQLLKSVQVQILSLRFYIFVHMAEFGRRA